MVGSILGNSVRRVEDPELISGQARFVDDIRLDDRTHAIFVRSPIAHARIVSVDIAEAEQAPGVLAVHTAASLPQTPVPPFVQVHEQITRGPLASGTVRYVGDPVALVVAETRAQAVDAAELVVVDYEALPAVVDMEAATAPDAPLQIPDLGTNVVRSMRSVQPEDAGDVLADAHIVVRARLENQRIATSPIEGNAMLVDPRPDPDDPSILVTAYMATQHPHQSRDKLATYAGLEHHQLRVITPHVGGAFGGKAALSSVHGALVSAARALGRPVAWAETRSEAMLSMHGRGQVQYAEMGFDRNGLITGLRARNIGDCGAYAGFGGALVASGTYLMAQGPYEIPTVDYSALAVMTNTTPNGAFRGAGRPEATAMLERLMDLGAVELGLAPEEIRRRNLIPDDAFPYATRTGARYDVGAYRAALDEALRIAGIDQLRTEQERRRNAGETRLLGVGVSTYVEVTGFGGTELGSVVIDADGGATVMSGTSAHGQGHATSFSMIVADRLGLPMEKIRYVQSDTARVRSGGGTGGSRSLQLGGSAVATAATTVREQAVELAAAMLEASAADLEVSGDGLRVAGVADASVTWAELAAEADHRGQPLRAELDVPQEGSTFPFGAHVAVVEVDVETGLAKPLRHVAVDDCGRVLNPTIVAGQQHGGIAQGIAQELWEGFVYDDEGQPLTSSFADYTVPTAADLISFEASTTQTPTDLNVLGAKGIGESGTIGSTPAVQSAVVDALAHVGVRHIDMPCTPARVWRAMQAAHSGQADPWREPPPAFDTLEPVRRP